MRAASRITRESAKHPVLAVEFHNVSKAAYRLMRKEFAPEQVEITYHRGLLALTGPEMSNGEPPFVVVHDVSWQTYERLIDALAETHVRLTYDEGTLEFMAPSSNHEWWKRRMATLLLVLCFEVGINFQGAGSTTFRRKALRKGLEPDECFYIENVEQSRGIRALKAKQLPPPDLAFEVDVFSSSVRRFPIYAKLGVSELWHFGDIGMRILRLTTKGKYRQVKKSGALPFLPVEEFFRFLCETQELTEFEVGIEFRKWIKKHIPPDALKS